MAGGNGDGLVHTEYQPLEQRAQSRRPTLGERTGFQAVITSPWVMRWAAIPITYNRLREIRKHPTVALARMVAAAPILAGEWSVKAKKGAPSGAADLIEETFFPLRDDFLENTALYGNIDFGYMPFEQVYANDGGRTRLVKIKPLYHDITEICIGHKGQFIGYRQVGIELGVANSLYVGFRVEGSFLYGRPLLENCVKPYEWWEACNEGAARYDKKIAGCHIIVEYPMGQSHDGPDGPMVDNGMLAQRILHTLESAGGVAIQRDMLPFAENLRLNPDEVGWKIWIMDQGGTQQVGFVDRLEYLDKLLCRGLLTPERSVMEGQHGTKAEAEAHLEVNLTTAEWDHRKMVRALNQQAGNQVLEMNYGTAARGLVEIEAAPLTDAKREEIKELYQEVLKNPQAAAQEFANWDMDAVRDAIGVPRRCQPAGVQDGRGLIYGDPNVQPEGARRVFRDGEGNLVDEATNQVLGGTRGPTMMGNRRPWRGLLLSNGDKLPEGSTKQVNGRGYVLQNGRWCRERGNDTSEHTPIEVTGQEFGVNWADKATRKAITPLLMKLRGDYPNDETQHDISVSRAGINEVLHHLPDAKAAMVLAKLPEVLKSMAWTHELPPQAPDQNIKKWHYFHNDVLLGGVPHDAEVKVREDANGHWFYDQHLKVT